jgi:sarcosine oxidase, subunit beta
VPADRVDVAILGAGIAGCALAYHLAGRGVGPVLLYDPRTPAAGATGRAAGVVTEQLWNEWDIAVTRDSRREYAELARRWEPSAFTENGFARWTARPDAADLLRTAVDRLRSWGVGVREISGGQLTQRVPWARLDDVAGAIVSEEDAVVTPNRIAEIYAEGARNRGVEVELSTPYHAAGASGSGWELRIGHRTVSARRLVVAAGAWSKAILAGVGHPQPLAPYRTQAAVLRPVEGGPSSFPSVHDVDLDIYVRPEANGRILAGDGTELVEVDPDRASLSGDDRFVTHLAEGFESRFPGWADAEMVRSWAGVCTSTPDRRPLVGPVPGASGLFVLTGFNGFGVMRGGGVAQRLADHLCAASPDPAPLAPVLPARFPPGTPAVVPRPGFTLEAGDNPRF